MIYWQLSMHCRPEQVERAYIECANKCASNLSNSRELIWTRPSWNKFTWLTCIAIVPFPHSMSAGSTCPGLQCGELHCIEQNYTILINSDTMQCLESDGAAIT